MINVRTIGLAVLVALVIGNVTAARAYINERDGRRENLIRAEAAEGKLAAAAERLERASKVRSAGERYQIGVREHVRNTEWGATAVPTAVTSRLCERAQCAPPPVPTPDS